MSSEFLALTLTDKLSYVCFSKVNSSTPDRKFDDKINKFPKQLRFNSIKSG